jgi:outer membrane protein TolC
LFVADTFIHRITGHSMKLFFRLSVVGLFASALSGCASYQPKALDPSEELRALSARDLTQFIVERAKPGQETTSSEIAFDPSDGLNEAEVVGVALTLNPDLRARRAEIGEAQATLITAGLWPNPEVGLTPAWGIGGASGWRLDADALFQLLRPGERDARKRAAEAHIGETREEVVAEELKLVAEVRRQRLAVFAADRRAALFKEAVDLRQRAAELVRRQRDLGEATALDVSATELELSEGRRDLRKANIELSNELRELNRLMGLPPDYDLKLTGLGETLTVTVFENIADDELDRRLLAGRPELRAKEAAYRRTEQELRLAVLRQYPRIGVGPAFEHELGGENSLGLALSLELPLFNQNQGEIAERQAARERTRLQYTAILHRLRAAAVGARADVRTAASEVETQEKEILPLLRRNQELFDAAVRARDINIIDWITAQQRAVNARREYLDALVRYRRAVIDLEAALGKPLTVPTTAPTTRPEQSATERR